MQMKKIVKEEKGSMAVYVSVVLLGFIIVLSAIYASAVAIRKQQMETNIKIKEAYEEENENIEETYQAKLEEMILAKWDLNKVRPVRGEDNVLVPVPRGYTASTVEGEKSVSTGFVIKQGSNGALTSGINEFVWVPVPEISDIYDETNNAGQLWNFSGTTATKRTYEITGYREPDIVTKVYNSETGAYDIDGADLIPDNLNQAGFSTTDTTNDLNGDGSITADDFKIQLQNEFDEMIESVEKYGGFYIGRYETGNLSGEIAVVQKGNIDISNQTWYTQYKVSKTIGANSNVVSSMIWGCEWDATLRWMQTSEVEKVKNFATSSVAYGNFSVNSIEYVENEETKTTTVGTGTQIPTGSAEITKINNIYDMSGNVYDWAIEAYDNNSRSRRGGYMADGISDIGASNRYGNYPTLKVAVGGSRSTLYISVAEEN